MKIKMNLKCAILILVATLTVTSAQSLSNSTNDANTNTEVARKHHFFPLGLFGFGGFQALALLYILKVKAVIVAIIIGLSVLYWAKFFVWKSDCAATTVIRESAPPSIIPYEGYSNHLSTGFSSHGPPSFSGPDPYSEYSHIHPDIEHISSGYGDDIHHHTGFDTSDVSSTPYKRVSTQQRQLGGSGFENIDWEDLLFKFLGVDSDSCRKRFVCEFDFKARRNPFMQMAFSMIRHTIFDRYRDASSENAPKRFKDCALIYKECSIPDSSSISNRKRL